MSVVEYIKAEEGNLFRLFFPEKCRAIIKKTTASRKIRFQATARMGFSGI
jgi:hypothetical protein